MAGARFLTGDHMMEHMVFGADAEVDDSGRLYLRDSSVGSLDLIDGNLFVNNGGCGNLTVDDGSVIGQGLSAGAVVINAWDHQTIRITNLVCSGLTIAGGAGDQSVIIDGLVMQQGRLIVTGTFDEFSIRNAVIGKRESSTTYSAGGLIDFTDVERFNLQATVYRAYRSALRLEDCVAGNVDILAIDPGVQADNTHDAIDLVGVNKQLAIYGAVYGAVNQATNPRYALAAAAGTLAPVDVFMSMAGYQTGAVNDLSGLVVVH